MAEASCNQLLIGYIIAHNKFAYIEERSNEPLRHYSNSDLKIHAEGRPRSCFTKEHIQFQMNIQACVKTVGSVAYNLVFLALSG